MNTSCVIFAAGTYYGNEPQAVAPGTLVIAADGGLDRLRACGLKPDVVIGDFDSATTTVPDDAVRLPTEHDDTDMLSALKAGWSRGARTFHIYGGLGGRIDHSIANLQYLALLARHGGAGYLYGEGTVATAICDGTLDFAAPSPDAPLYPVSALSCDNLSHGVNEIGTKYELRNGTLTNGGMTSDGISGVSNEFMPDTPASIGVADGTLFVTFPIGTPMPSVTTARTAPESLGPLSAEVSKLLNPKAR